MNHKTRVFGMVCLSSALVCHLSHASNETLDIQSSDAYWQKKATHNSTAGVDNYSAAHPHDISSSTQAAGELGAAARNNYGNAQKVNDGLNAHMQGGGSIVDLSGTAMTNTKTTKYDVCILNNPHNPSACATDKASSDAYKQCKQAHPADYKTACTNVAGALASLDFRQQCSNTRPYIKISYIPDPNTFDITTLILGVDPQLTGAPQITNPAGFPISGVCNNGAISCSSGTFDSCRYYTWADIGGGVPGFREVATSTNLAGCYCINLSCGSNLPLLNGPQILRDLSMGATAAVLKSGGEGKQITDTKPDYANLTVTLSASLLSDCNTGTGNSTPKVQSSDPTTTNLTGLAQKMTNANPTVDEIQESGVSNANYMDTVPDQQGSDISTAGFADPAVRAQWRTNYQVNGNNYYKLIKNTDEIAASNLQESTCKIKRNYQIYVWQSSDIFGTPQNPPAGWQPAYLNGYGYQNDSCTTWSVSERAGGQGNYPRMVINASNCGQRNRFVWSAKKWSIAKPAQVKNAFITKLSADDGTGWVVNETVVVDNGCYETSGMYSWLSGGCSGPLALNNLTATNGLSVLNLSSFGRSPGGGNSGIYSDTIEIQYDPDEQQEAVTNECLPLENDSNCSLKSEIVDGISERINFLDNTLRALPSCKTFTGAYTDYTVCRPWWERTKTYSCKRPVTTNQDVANIVKRGNSVSESTTIDSSGNYTFRDTAQDASGSWVTSNKQSQLAIAVQTPGQCDMVCKVSKFAVDTQDRISFGSTVNSTLPTKAQRTGVNILPVTGATGSSAGQKSARKEYQYKYCNPKVNNQITSVGTDWMCPVESNETVEVDCGCPNTFGEAIGTITTLTEAAKNSICTTGAIK